MADTNEQLRFLSQTTFIEEATTPYKLRFTLYSIFTAFIFFLIWASFANVKEIVKTNGKIIPMGQVQTIQHLEGGIIENHSVREGDIVKKGQILIKIDDSHIKAEYERIEVKQFSLKILEERLASTVSAREANFSKISNQYSNLVEQQKEIIISSKMAKNEEEEVLRKQIDQKKGILRTLVNQKRTTSQNVSIAKEGYQLEKQAYEAGIGTKTSYLSAKSNYNNQKGELERIKAQINTAQDQIEEFESRLASQGFSSKDKIQQELAKVKNEITENNKIMESLNKRVEKLIIKSPVNGIVKGLEYTTVGAVIAPGAKIMEIVPTDQELVAEIKIFPHDVGHVKIGDQVNIKVTSFDFSRYGTIQGVLKAVSATTFSSDRGETYYKANVSLSKNYIGKDPQKNIILPGMEVLGDIVTGDKTVMQFLLKPVHISLQGAFSER